MVMFPKPTPKEKAPSAGLSRKTPLQRKKPMAKTRSKRSYKGLEKCGYCAYCGMSGPTEWHHIIFRSHGGTENKENLIELGCAFVCSCHADVHAGRISADELRAAKERVYAYA